MASEKKKRIRKKYLIYPSEFNPTSETTQAEFDQAKSQAVVRSKAPDYSNRIYQIISVEEAEAFNARKYHDAQ